MLIVCIELSNNNSVYDTILPYTWIVRGLTGWEVQDVGDLDSWISWCIPGLNPIAFAADI